MQDYICNGSLLKSAGKSVYQYHMQDYLTHANVSPNFQAYLSKITSTREPLSYDEAALDSNWIEAMNQELQALKDNVTWSLVDLPPGKTPIGCRWVFKIKYKTNGEIERIFD